MSNDFEICGHESKKFDYLEACCCEKGHEGNHVYWFTKAWDENNRHGTWGINYYDETGLALYNVEYKGQPNPEEVAIVYALFMAAAATKERRDES